MLEHCSNIDDAHRFQRKTMTTLTEQQNERSFDLSNP
jgi:hypothetical protein